MSAAVTPARRLLALLEEEPSLESRPRDEVDADLAMLGLDPTGSIRLAREMAAENAGPATALLDAVIDGESVEAEIAALETADIDDVRGRLPAGTVAAVTAEAQRRAGQHSNVVGIGRRRRSAVWAWTGSLVGMAACALIVVAVWWPTSELSEPLATAQMSEVVPETAANSLERRTRQDSETTPPPAMLSMSAPRAESEAEEPESVGNRATAVAPPPSQADFDSIGASEADNALPPVAADAPPRPPPLPLERQPQIGTLAAEQSAGGNALLAEGAGAALMPPSFDSSLWEDPISVTDVMIVDPTVDGLESILMPARAQGLFSDYRADVSPAAKALSDRLEEARRPAEGRPIVALLSLRSTDREFDAILVRRGAGEAATADDAARGLLIRWFGDQADQYSLIALPSVSR